MLLVQQARGAGIAREGPRRRRTCFGVTLARLPEQEGSARGFCLCGFWVRAFRETAVARLCHAAVPGRTWVWSMGVAARAAGVARPRSGLSARCGLAPQAVAWKKRSRGWFCQCGTYGVLCTEHGERVRDVFFTSGRGAQAAAARLAPRHVPATLVPNQDRGFQGSGGPILEWRHPTGGFNTHRGFLGHQPCAQGGRAQGRQDNQCTHLCRWGKRQRHARHCCCNAAAGDQLSQTWRKAAYVLREGGAAAAGLDGVRMPGWCVHRPTIQGAH